MSFKQSPNGNLKIPLVLLKTNGFTIYKPIDCKKLYT